MRKLCVIALVAVFPIPFVLSTAQAGGKPKEKDVKIEGTITKDDPIDKRRMTPSQVHTVKMRAGQTYTIDMVSTEMDSYLFLDDAQGKQLAEDDDSGGNLNAQIVFNCTKDGDYKVVCTVFSPEMKGKYVLTVKNTGAAAVVTSTHTLLIGKEAPDFQGDFAINGKADKLSDHKGKVVVLAFWEARNPAALEALTHLNDWHKASKADGLDIIGVKFYNSEIGEGISFDKEAG